MKPLCVLTLATLFACGEKSETDTALDSNDQSVENGSDGNGTEGNGSNGGNGEGSDNPGDPNEDMDGDGFIGADDCDDTDPYTYPGAMEFPGDGVDQDCDGSEPPLKEPGIPFPNPSFDLEADGYPLDWNDMGAGWAWQADGAEIFNANGATGAIFTSHSGVGALKMWGDYGTSFFGNGESLVYQQFLPSSDWRPAEKTFWIDGWVMIHETDALQNDASYKLGIRCLSEFFGTITIEAEGYSDSLNSESVLNTWSRLWAQVECPVETSMVQSVLIFEQSQPGSDSVDHGAVFIDDVSFGTL